MRSSQTGFSLIELLVAIVILAVVISTASLGFGRSEQQRFSSELEQSRQWLAQISTEAILSGALWGVTVSDNELRAYVWTGTQWLEAADIEPFSLPDNIRYSHTVATNDIVGESSPQFTFFPTGQIMPAVDIVLSSTDASAAISWQQSYTPTVVYPDATR